MEKEPSRKGYQMEPEGIIKNLSQAFSLNPFQKGIAKQQPLFEVGSRVEIDWFKRGPVSEEPIIWQKGFVTKVLSPTSYQVIREEDLSTTQLEAKHLRSSKLDAEGFVSAAGLGYLKSVRDWVEAGNDVNVVVDGFTALYLACDEGQVGVARYLVEEAGAREDVENAYGVRAWDMAFLGGRPAAVDYAVRRARLARPPFLEVAEGYLPGVAGKGAALFLPRAAFLRLDPPALPAHARADGLLEQLPEGPEGPGQGPGQGQGRGGAQPEAVFVSLPRQPGGGGGGGGGGGLAAPDPGGALWRAVRAFLARRPRVRYVWLACACLPPPPAALGRLASPATRRAHETTELAATLAALHRCSHFLALPPVGMLEFALGADGQVGGLSPEKAAAPTGAAGAAAAALPGPRGRSGTVMSYGMTNVAELLGGAWPRVELLLAMLAGKRCYLHFLLDGVAEGALPLQSLGRDPEAGHGGTSDSGGGGGTSDGGGGGGGEEEEEPPARPLHDAIKAAIFAGTTDENRMLAQAVVTNLVPEVPDPLACLRDLAYTLLSLPARGDQARAAALLQGRLGIGELAWMQVNLLGGPSSLDRVARALGPVPDEEAHRAAVLRAALLGAGHAMGRLPDLRPSTPVSPASPAAAAAEQGEEASAGSQGRRLYEEEEQRPLAAAAVPAIQGSGFLVGDDGDSPLGSARSARSGSPLQLPTPRGAAAGASAAETTYGRVDSQGSLGGSSVGSLGGELLRPLSPQPKKSHLSPLQKAPLGSPTGSRPREGGGMVLVHGPSPGEGTGEARRATYAYGSGAGAATHPPAGRPPTGRPRGKSYAELAVTEGRGPLGDPAAAGAAPTGAGWLRSRASSLAELDGGGFGGGGLSRRSSFLSSAAGDGDARSRLGTVHSVINFVPSGGGEGGGEAPPGLDGDDGNGDQPAGVMTVLARADLAERELRRSSSTQASEDHSPLLRLAYGEPGGAAVTAQEQQQQQQQQLPPLPPPDSPVALPSPKPVEPKKPPLGAPAMRSGTTAVDNAGEQYMRDMEVELDSGSDDECAPRPPSIRACRQPSVRSGRNSTNGSEAASNGSTPTNKSAPRGKPFVGATAPSISVQPSSRTAAHTYGRNPSEAHVLKSDPKPSHHFGPRHVSEPLGGAGRLGGAADAEEMGASSFLLRYFGRIFNKKEGREGSQ